MFCSLVACCTELSGLWVLLWGSVGGVCLMFSCLLRGSLGFFVGLFVLVWVVFWIFYQPVPPVIYSPWYVQRQVLLWPISDVRDSWLALLVRDSASPCVVSCHQQYIHMKFSVLNSTVEFRKQFGSKLLYGYAPWKPL